MPDPVSPVVAGLEMFELTAGGPQAQQPQYLPLPLLRANGVLTSRWHFTDEERELIARGGDVLVTHFTGGTIYPQRVTVVTLDEDPSEMAVELGLIDPKACHG